MPMFCFSMFACQLEPRGHEYACLREHCFDWAAPLSNPSSRMISSGRKHAGKRTTIELLAVVKDTPAKILKALLNFMRSCRLGLNLGISTISATTAFFTAAVYGFFPLSTVFLMFRASWLPPE
ncbi:hypothetical protein BZA05DRAFT_416801 [Tricharina praecox]|uniref:uncharacterized protein n=1 Tax=Tricharina praecox TaxID=43433 RepID=UPI00221EF842|nr:uncharacterized protein BZA05DRAFT_416801 [Tricharina praecox]KAI5855204.1 hypothetical protein BZA05DRAFT_416801 [Tricharina praecox]